MDPITLGAIASTLIKSGPDLIRGIGSFFGSDTAATANKVANLVDVATGKEQPQQSLEQALSTLSAEDLLKLQNISSQCEVELARIAANKETTLHQQTQQTIQNGDNASDEYVRRTRPQMARQSGYITFAYVLLMELLAAFGKGAGANFDIAALLVSPLIGYMGLREIGKWRDGKPSVLSGLSTTISNLVKK